ncbi:MAG: hypothetical protein ACYDFT_02950 [Thermoplasmata archaeon]
MPTRWGYGPSPSGTRLPPFGTRLTIGILILIPSVAITVGAPAYLLELLGHGQESTVTDLTIVIGGSIVSVLSSAAYVLRPTRAYGPTSAARSAALILYLTLLASYARLTIPLGLETTATITYSEMLLALSVVPLLWLVSALLVTLSDIWDPVARLRIDFPS